VTVSSTRSRADLRSGVPKIRQTFRRLIPAAAAVLCLAACPAQTALAHGRLPVSLLLGLEIAGTVLLVVATALAISALVVPAVLTVGLAVGASVALGGPEVLAPILGTALLLAAELAFWSIDCSRPAQAGLRVGTVRGLRLAVLGLAGCVAGLALSAASELPLAGGFVLTAAGTLAALGMLAILAWMGRSALNAR